MDGRLTVRKVRSWDGEITVPGDKSLTHRAILLGALAEGETRIEGALDADDCRRMIAACRSLGADIREGDGPGRWRVQGGGFSGLSEPGFVLDLGNSGTAIRLLSGVLAGRPFTSVLTGDESLRSRPMRRVVEPLRRMGATILGRENGDRAPLAIRGPEGPLRPIRWKLPVATAQVKSAILLAGLQAEGRTRVGEPSPSRDHTERLLAWMGAPVSTVPGGVEVEGGRPLQGRSIAIPGDFSAAAFFIVGATIVPRSRIRLRNVGLNPTRTGMLEVLKEMGADIHITPDPVPGPEPRGDLEVRAAGLKGIEIGGALIPRLIDELPILAVAACAAEGETVVRDAQELRVKESDRIASLVAELGKMGAPIEALADGFRVRGPARLKGAVCRAWGDHRIAMALAIAGLIAEGETVIEDAGWIDTSFPGFAELLERLSGKT